MGSFQLTRLGVKLLSCRFGFTYLLTARAATALPSVARLFSKLLAPIYILTSRALEIPVGHILASLGVVILTVKFCPSDEREVHSSTMVLICIPDCW